MNIIAQGRSGKAGILLLMRRVTDVFSADSKGDARRARDTEIPDTGEFDNDGRLAIVIKWADREIWQVRRGGAWVDVCVMDSDGE